MKKKPGLTSLDQWEFIGLESLAMQNAAKNLIKHQRTETSSLLEKQQVAREELEKNLKERYGLLPLKNTIEKNDHRDTLSDWQKSERHEMNARHIHQIKEVENSQDPERKAEAIIKGEALDNSKIDYAHAELTLEHHHRDKIQDLQDEQHERISELSMLHKDGIISNNIFHEHLDKLLHDNKENVAALATAHENNIEAAYQSSQPIHTANEITNSAHDRFERVSENLKDLENYINDLSNGKGNENSNKLSENYEYAPEDLRDAQIFNTPAGAIVAMPSQELEEELEAETNIQAQFENATIMSKSPSQGIER